MRKISMRLSMHTNLNSFMILLCPRSTPSGVRRDTNPTRSHGDRCTLTGFHRSTPNGAIDAALKHYANRENRIANRDRKAKKLVASHGVWLAWGVGLATSSTVCLKGSLEETSASREALLWHQERQGSKKPHSRRGHETLKFHAVCPAVV